MYCTGEGLDRNLEEAVKWYRRSAEQGNRYAQYNLAVMLLKGQGTTSDVDEAFHWCRTSAEQGLAEAQLQLGDLYRSGQGAATSNCEPASPCSAALRNHCAALALSFATPRPSR